MAAGGAFVVDLFHTLVDTEHLRPRGFQEVAATADVCGVDRDRFSAFWSATYVERETTPRPRPGPDTVDGLRESGQRSVSGIA